MERKAVQHQPCLSLPAGHRIYAIGDIHGRLDLFEQLIQLIRRDTEARPGAVTHLIILGDFINRGPSSKALIEIFKRAADWPNLVVLRGNHEDALIQAAHGNRQAMTFWIKHGGRSTLKSFGADVPRSFSEPDEIQRLIERFIPVATIMWLASRPLDFRLGDYYFVHAGIQPGVALDQQTMSDKLWIREPFLSSEADHGVIVVHGHSAEPAGVQLRPNRIGVDTGAWTTGDLSAVGLEGDQRWSLTARGAPGPKRVARTLRPVLPLPGEGRPLPTASARRGAA